jgi:hypothetical protein
MALIFLPAGAPRGLALAHLRAEAPKTVREGRGDMYSERKILLMTKLALYDKRYGEQDKRGNDYFRHDFIYKKNMWTRMCAFLGTLFILAVYWANKLLVEKVDLLEIDFRKEGVNAGIFVLAVLAFYTVIGTISAARQYGKMQERLKTYSKMLTALDRMRPEARRKPEEESNLYYEGDFADTRSDSTLV